MPVLVMFVAAWVAAAGRLAAVVKLRMLPSVVPPVLMAITWK